VRFGFVLCFFFPPSLLFPRQTGKIKAGCIPLSFVFPEETSRQIRQLKGFPRAILLHCYPTFFFLSFLLLQEFVKASAQSRAQLSPFSFLSKFQ